MHSANRAKQRLRTSAAAAELTENKKTEIKNKKFLTPTNSLNSPSPVSRRCKSLERKNVSSRNKNNVKQREVQSPKPIRMTGKTLFYLY